MKTLILAASALALALSSAPAVEAQTAARVEGQTRPNFGLLLDPPSRQRARTHRRWSYGQRYPGWRGAPPPIHRPVGSEEVVLIDCGGNPGSGALEAAVHRVRPGGTLVIRARGGACVGWINVDKPLTIIGEGGFDPRRWSENPSASLQAPDGLPCITVASGVRLELRDLVLTSPNGGEAACIVNYGGQVIMSRAGMRHSGDEAAILSDGGLVDLRDVVIDARTLSAAIVADGATLTTWETVVTGAQSGIDLTPGAGDPSRITSTTLVGAESPNNYGPRAIGVVVRSRRDYGRVDISNTKICGYVEGVAIEGASVTIDNSKICKSDKGVVLYNGEVNLTNSRVRAETGVALASGRAVVTDNSFVGVKAVFQPEPRAQLTASGNRVWSASLCQPVYRRVYRDRYAPDWFAPFGAAYTCERSAYPRAWWDEMDGAYGDPYSAHQYGPAGYDRFLQGYGWYDAYGRYIDRPRPFGEARWGDGRGRFW
ncbi:hypothetical protein BZG35_06260 [Brevundimonas sp. LM2]|uniref:hypothetical protein n=1 Tax=Brevundimonas sp. LM2 TaxID=1938605 RepID=UPI000983E972|nr:hypothetical protein [Brevundimonas sp. LM2]AQR61297.1 hypothetical protein BZG35_06260 [Brevundimonas sp. LM2]